MAVLFTSLIFSACLMVHRSCYCEKRIIWHGWRVPYSPNYNAKMIKKTKNKEERRRGFRFIFGGGTISDVLKSYRGRRNPETRFRPKPSFEDATLILVIFRCYLDSLFTSRFIHRRPFSSLRFTNVERTMQFQQRSSKTPKRNHGQRVSTRRQEDDTFS